MSKQVEIVALLFNTMGSNPSFIITYLDSVSVRKHEPHCTRCQLSPCFCSKAYPSPLRHEASVWSIVGSLGSNGARMGRLKRAFLTAVKASF